MAKTQFLSNKVLHTKSQARFTILVQSLKSVFLGQFLSKLSNLYFQDNSCPSTISQFYISRTILVESLKSVCLGQFLSKYDLSILYFQDNSCPISQICMSRTILVQVQSLNSIFPGLLNYDWVSVPLVYTQVPLQ